MKSLFNVFALFALVMLIGCDASKKTADAIDTGEEVMETAAPFVINPATTPGKISWKAANQRYAADGGFASWNFSRVDMGREIESLDADLVIDLASVNEKSEKLANHLKAWDYFNVEEYRTATANISNVRKSGDGYVAEMTLKMRGAKQVIETPFEVVNKKPLRVRGTAEVDRRIFKIGTNESGKYTATDGAGDIITVTYDTAVKL